MDLAELTYTIDTRPLVAARREIRGIRTEARNATDSLMGIGGRNATRSLDRTGRSATATSRAFGNTSRNVNATSQSFDRVSRETRTAEREIARARRSTLAMSTATGLLGRALGVIGFSSLVRGVGQYNSALAEVSTLVDTTAFDMAALSEEAQRQSRQFGTLPVDNVQSFYQAISGGATTAEEATAAVDAANRLAVAGVSDVSTSIGALLSVMNSYSGEALSLIHI